MRFLTAGSRSVLVELGGLEEVLRFHDGLREAPPEGCIDLVPAARTLLIVFDPARTTRERLIRGLAEPAAVPTATPRPKLVEIPVVYDGIDLAEIARLSGLSIAEVVKRHARARYTVAFCGFAPGFAYLSGLDPTLHLPRRRVPRTRVAPGSIAIADRFTSVYPSESPGGWHLVGRTTAALWDLDRRPPGLLTPGTKVRFVRAAS
ncbi:allophanate hydrolase subunit 1 [Streptomyces chartreusis]|uniref:5-oxoprolinase subunit B family protein n=1 Tax=Streptomyces chartreusis TaxID=1969 RepID=UPI0034096188